MLIVIGFFFYAFIAVPVAILEGVHIGTKIGRVAVRATGSFNIQTVNGVCQGISWKFCRILQRADGYGYFSTTSKKGGASSLA
jgi:hypothetical protein